MKYRNLRLFAAALTFAAASHAAIPTPESWFGHRMGADRKLVSWDKVTGYYQALARESDRIRVDVIGQSVEGRPFLAAIIASPDTLRDLDRYREIQERLSDPRRTPEAEAEKLIAQGKTVVMITCSIHSTEVASTMTAMEFVHRLLTDEKPKFRAILENTIFILVPSLNPDGIDIVARWYEKTLGTSYEGTSPPELYHKYVGHDNNRDWYIFSQPETRLTISKLHNVWHPQIVYDVHQQGQSSSRMFVPPWMDPIDPNVDPIIAQMANAIGAGMASDMTSAGLQSIAINAIYDFWTPARHYQSYHGGVRILSESASARLATPVTISFEDLNQTAPGYSPRERSWNHLEVWRGGTWRVRDIVEYQLIAMESCLYQAAVRREDMLRAFYNVGKRAIARTSPHAFVIPADQRDPGAARVLLETLQFGMVEIDRAAAPFTAGGKQYAAGSYVIRMQQPYSSFAKTLLERQNYPDLRLYPGGPPKRPYDVTAHTLPLLMGVSVDTVKAAFDASTARASSFEFNGPALSASDTDTWRAVNRAWDSGKPVWRNPKTGDFRLEGGNGLRRIRQPRVGLYRSYVPSMDEGWTRWLLEQFGFRYENVFNKDLQAGNLKSRFDVIVFPEQRAETIHNGYREGNMPPEFSGGVGDKGADALRTFTSKGGTVVCLNDASEYAMRYLGAGVRDALAGVPSRDFYAPGSLLNVRADLTHWLTLGMPKEFSIWFESSPAFELPSGSRERAVVTYPDTRLLASGWLLGDKLLHRKAAVVDVPSGSGRFVLFGIRPQYRAQSYLTFKMFFNSLTYFE